jgi:hypothetical protein
LRNVWVDFTVGTFKIGVCDQARSTVTWASYVDNVEVVFLDQAVEMDVDEVQTGRGAPMTQEAGLDVLEFERFLQEGIGIKIDLPDGEIVCGRQ